MKLLWIGSYASDELLAAMPVKTIGQASGVTSQRSFINGIDQCIADQGTVLDTINVQGIPGYPTYPEKYYNETIWSRNGKSCDVSIGFDNTDRFHREISQRRSMVRAAEKWASGIDPEEQVYIFLYEPVLCRLAAVKRIKQLHKKTVCTLIVPDIPEFVGKKGNLIKQTLLQVRKKAVDRYLRYIDRYVFYAKKMAEYYHVKPENYTVIEGSIDPRDSRHLLENQAENDQFVLLYSGAITYERAVPNFVKGFMQYPGDDISLWLTGGGNCDELIHQLEKEDRRIKHFGFLDTREEVLEKEANATALLHIRDPKAVSSSYCFPSKLFEYLASGKPVLSVRIEGIPEEYYQYLIEIPGFETKDIAEAIERVKDMSVEERKAFGQRAREFVVGHKSSFTQAKKLMDFAIGD